MRTGVHNMNPPIHSQWCQCSGVSFMASSRTSSKRDVFGPRRGLASSTVLIVVGRPRCGYAVQGGKTFFPTYTTTQCRISMKRPLPIPSAPRSDKEFRPLLGTTSPSHRVGPAPISFPPGSFYSHRWSIPNRASSCCPASEMGATPFPTKHAIPKVNWAIQILISMRGLPTRVFLQHFTHIPHTLTRTHTHSLTNTYTDTLTLTFTLTLTLTHIPTPENSIAEMDLEMSSIGIHEQVDVPKQV